MNYNPGLIKNVVRRLYDKYPGIPILKELYDTTYKKASVWIEYITKLTLEKEEHLIRTKANLVMSLARNTVDMMQELLPAGEAEHMEE